MGKVGHGNPARLPVSMARGKEQPGGFGRVVLETRIGDLNEIWAELTRRIQIEHGFVSE